ncbi:MAG TPA: ATP-dependent endonuclease [Acidobacteriota bacterium]|nr:ATP-dependent endonuclease [Syntrophales bacterium]HXK61903.1 ATP-dependent endonuclease [Acidobacteriota bacterium]
MIIKVVHVKNFRSILDERIDCDKLTVLVGRNGTGKSSFLRALELFYDPKAAVTAEDFYAEDTSNEIEVAVTFTELSTEARSLFASYLDGNDLSVARVFSLSAKKQGTYHGMKLQNPDFADIRNAGGKTDIRNKYNEVITRPEYSSLPKVNNADRVEEELRKWETANPNSCVRLRDDGQFFGFTEVGNGYLGRHTRFIHIPAVRDASDDATEGKGSCVTEIMDIVVRRTLANRQDFIKLRDDTQTQYREIMDPSKLTELSALQTQLSETLQYYTPEANVSMEWTTVADIDFPLPKVEVKLFEDGYKSSVQRTGHGLQRAFILTMLQHLVAVKGVETSIKKDLAPETEILEQGNLQLPGLVLAIEEPELYQHPSRQRHMASVLLKLSQGTIPGVAKMTQVLYTTHSPLFVGLDRFDHIRLLRKIDDVPGNPRVTKATKAELSAVANDIWVASGCQGSMFTANTLRPRLQAVITPWVNEGFFADVAVLVEGEDDRAAILGVATSMGYNFDSEGISVIPCLGKNNLDRPLVIFRHLDIPVYVIWDSDYGESGANPEDNRKLLRILGETEEDWPCAVKDSHACFKTELETTLEEEIGKELFDRLIEEAKGQYGITKKKDALKNPVVLQYVVEKASFDGKTSTTLSDIVSRITAMKPRRGSGQ